MDKAEARKLFEEAKENARRRSSCAKHSFPEWERKLGQRFTCAACGCTADLSYVCAYVDGYAAAGRNPNDIVPNYRG